MYLHGGAADQLPEPPVRSHHGPDRYPSVAASGRSQIAGTQGKRRAAGKQRAGGCPGGRGTRPPARTLRGYGHLYQCRNVRQTGGTVLLAVGRLPRPAGDPDAPAGAFGPCLYAHPEAVAHHRRPAGGGRRNASGRHPPRTSDRGVIVPIPGPSRPVGPLGFSFLRKSPYLYTLYGKIIR